MELNFLCHFPVCDAKHLDETWGGAQTAKHPDVFKDPDVWCQVNKTSKVFYNFFHLHPDVCCHIDTELICSVTIMVFFNIICHYLNPFFTKLSLKSLPNLFMDKTKIVPAEMRYRVPCKFIT